jgi:hypothetical protein
MRDGHNCYIRSASIMSSAPNNDERNNINEMDPIWTSSRTARQIYALGEVDKVSVYSLPMILVR